jgi:hypothetical protein
MYPNNPKAEIQKLECFDAEGQLNPRSLEKVLRDAGLSKKDATTASSIVKRALTERVDAAPTPGEPDAVVIEAEILAALDRRSLEKALQKRIQKGK